MARKSSRSSGTGGVSAHKRVASITAAPSAEAKRSKKETPTKSQYFSAVGTGEELPGHVNDSNPGSPSSHNQEASDFDVKDSDSEPSDADDDDFEDEDDKPSTQNKSSARKGKTSSTAVRPKGGNASSLAVKEAGPGTQVITKKPKARSAGNTPYTDETIHPNTLLFLQDLKANNNREWLKMNDAEFCQAERDWHSFVEDITEKLTEIDDTVPELPVKDVVFRIYRDVRFSPDPTPYKPYFSAAWSRTGRKGPYAHYYVQISPNDESFVGGGLWHPEAAPTAAMRDSIDRHPERLKSVLMSDGMRKSFFEGVPKKEQRIVTAFVATNSGNALKTKPKNYDADHKDIQLLRLRNYTVGSKLKDDEILGVAGKERITGLLSVMQPFIQCINSIVMPDEEGSVDEAESASVSANDQGEAEG